MDLDPQTEDESTVLARLKQKGSELTGPVHEPVLLLLADLRRDPPQCGQCLTGPGDTCPERPGHEGPQLLAVTEQCHPETLRQMRWANAKVKDTTAQIMVTG